MSDLTYADAEVAAMARRAAELGASPDEDAAAVAALSDQLGFVRNNPITEEESPYEGPPAENGEPNIVHTVWMWGCDDEARIVLGRLAQRGWSLVRSPR